MDVKLLRHDVLYRGKVFDLIVDTVMYPSGREGVREIAHHPGGAVAVPLFDDGRVIFVKQLRYPFGRHLLELPAGKLNPGENPEVAAARELEEETGWKAGRWRKLCSLYTTPGFCDEILHIYLATDLHPSPGGPRREEGESSMSIETHSLDEATKMIERQEIHDAKTIVGVFLARSGR